MPGSRFQHFFFGALLVALAVAAMAAPAHAADKSPAETLSKSATRTTTKSATKSATKKAPAAARECKSDEDCALVPVECCPCFSGGKQRAIAKKDRDAYEAARLQRCGDTACIEMMSKDPSCDQRAACKVGRCALEPTPTAPAAPGH